MLDRLLPMAMREVSMMGRLFMLICLMVLRDLFMMMSGLLVVLSGFLMMVCGVF